MGYSPIKLDKISQYLLYYPKEEESKIIFDGIRYGFYINYNGPRRPFDSKIKNLCFQIQREPD